MASYKILWKKSAKKELLSLENSVIKKIIDAINRLADNPFPSNSKKLIGAEHTYRLRVGRYRIVYTVERDVLVITVIRISHRKDVYKRLF